MGASWGGQDRTARGWAERIRRVRAWLEQHDPADVPLDPDNPKETPAPGGTSGLRGLALPVAEPFAVWARQHERDLTGRFITPDAQQQAWKVPVGDGNVQSSGPRPGDRARVQVGDELRDGTVGLTPQGLTTFLPDGWEVPLVLTQDAVLLPEGDGTVDAEQEPTRIVYQSDGMVITRHGDAFRAGIDPSSNDAQASAQDDGTVKLDRDWLTEATARCECCPPAATATAGGDRAPGIEPNGTGKVPCDCILCRPLSPEPEPAAPAGDGTVNPWRLVGTSDQGGQVFIAPLGTPPPQRGFVELSDDTRAALAALSDLNRDEPEAAADDDGTVDPSDASSATTTWDGDDLLVRIPGRPFRDAQPGDSLDLHVEVTFVGPDEEHDSTEACEAIFPELFATDQRSSITAREISEAPITGPDLNITVNVPPAMTGEELREAIERGLRRRRPIAVHQPARVSITTTEISPELIELITGMKVGEAPTDGDGTVRKPVAWQRRQAAEDALHEWADEHCDCNAVPHAMHEPTCTVESILRWLVRARQST